MPTDRDAICYTRQGNELQLRICVVPRSSRSRIGEVANGRLRVHLHAPPIQGRANKELIDLIAEAFGVPKSTIKIASGASARYKTLHLDNPRRLPDALG